MIDYLKIRKNYLLKFLLFIFFLFEIGCGKPNNTLEGFVPNNPSQKTTPVPIPPTPVPFVDHYIEGKEFTSLSQKNKTTAGGYKISATLGDQLPSGTKTTNSGHFKVEYTIQGQLNSIK